MKTFITILAATIGLTVIAAQAQPLSKAHKTELETLVQNPTSDLSSLNDDDLIIASQLDAIAYFKSHPTPPKSMEADPQWWLNLMQNEAPRHNLYGIDGNQYGGHFASTLQALIAGN
jgi:hypothetical protein